MYTLYSSVRPFGISTIFAGIDKTGPSLYVVEPSGVCLVCSLLAAMFAYTDLSIRDTMERPLARDDNWPRLNWRNLNSQNSRRGRQSWKPPECLSPIPHPASVADITPEYTLSMMTTRRKNLNSRCHGYAVRRTDYM